jgi:hypothetical protein
MSATAISNPKPKNKPVGYTAIGVFLLFGATMATYASVTLAWPGTFLDRGWMLNPVAHQQLATLGRVLAFPFLFLAFALFLAGLGWFRRRRWGWTLAVVIISINMLGDLFNGLRGEWVKGGVGVVIAGLLLTYITRRQVRDYFRAT